MQAGAHSRMAGITISGRDPRRAVPSLIIWFLQLALALALGHGRGAQQRTHEMDVCRWALGVDWPTRVSSNGGRYQFQMIGKTPDTQTIAWDFAGGKTMSWEGRSCNDYPLKAVHAELIYGTEGTALLDGR